MAGLRVLIATDSFEGTLTAAGWRQDDAVVELPLAAA
jgi:hypothetical protein